MKTEDVQTILSSFLSRPPCRSGLRLRSEPELGRILDASRQTVRRAIDGLVEQGYLTRKHGSGTYIRKAFPLEDAPETKLVRQLTHAIPDQIFIEDMENTRHRPETKGHCLRIGISVDSALTTHTNQCIYNGARSRLEALGHVPVNYSQYNYSVDSGMKSIEALAAELSTERCDGYLIENWWADRFEQAFRMIFPNGGIPPITYFWPGSCTDIREPLVQLDSDDAVRRAVRILYEQGCRRIAIMSLDWKRKDLAAEQRCYFSAINEYDLDYRGAFSSFGYANPTMQDEFDRLWQGDDRPDGLYVAEDHFLPEVAEWLAAQRIVPGRDLKIITLSNKGGFLPASIDWSCLEFNPFEVGVFAVEAMIRSINSAGGEMCSFSHQAAWKPGRTHLSQ